MNVTFYNGFAANCNMSGFEVTPPGLKEPLPILFHPNHMNSMLAILEKESYTIKGRKIECGQGNVFDIPDFIFEGKPPKVFLLLNYKTFIAHITAIVNGYSSKWLITLDIIYYSINHSYFRYYPIYILICHS